MVRMGPTYTWLAHPPSPKISINNNKYSSLNTLTTFSFILSSKLHSCNLLVPPQPRKNRSPLITLIFLLLALSRGALTGSTGEPTGILQEGQQCSTRGLVSGFEWRKHGFQHNCQDQEVGSMHSPIEYQNMQAVVKF